MGKHRFESQLHHCYLVAFRKSLNFPDPSLSYWQDRACPLGLLAVISEIPACETPALSLRFQMVALLKNTFLEPLPCAPWEEQVCRSHMMFFPKVRNSDISRQKIYGDIHWAGMEYTRTWFLCRQQTRNKKRHFKEVEDSRTAPNGP